MPKGNDNVPEKRANKPPDKFECNGHGVPISNQSNIRLAVQRMGIKLRYDLFADRILINGRYLDDAHMDRLYLAIDEKFDILPARKFFETVIKDAARQNSFHPVRDYLDALVWDGEKRIDTWLPKYAGAKDTGYTRAVGRLTLIAAVRRVRQPGCKFDEMLVLESNQGLNKSSALRTLAVNDEWFSDDLPLNAKSKEVIEQMSGKWILEAGELRGMRKADVDHLKSFLSRQVDRARLAYGHLPSEHRRQCIVVGTTNNERYLKDPTGNRRFWPVAVKEFDLDALRRDRDQLWAEASAAEAKGESIRLDPELYEDAAQEQKKREMNDPWLDILRSHLNKLKGKLRSLDAWHIVGTDPAKATQEQNERLGDCMRALGFRRTKKRFGGPVENAYVKGEQWEQAKRINVRRQLGGGVEVWQSDE